MADTERVNAQKASKTEVSLPAKGRGTSQRATRAQAALSTASQLGSAQSVVQAMASGGPSSSLLTSKSSSAAAGAAAGALGAAGGVGASASAPFNPAAAAEMSNLYAIWGAMCSNTDPTTLVTDPIHGGKVPAIEALVNEMAYIDKMYGDDPWVQEQYKTSTFSSATVQNAIAQSYLFSEVAAGRPGWSEEALFDPPSYRSKKLPLPPDLNYSPNNPILQQLKNLIETKNLQGMPLDSFKKTLDGLKFVFSGQGGTSGVFQQYATAMFATARVDGFGLKSGWQTSTWNVCGGQMVAAVNELNSEGNTGVRNKMLLPLTDYMGLFGASPQIADDEVNQVVSQITSLSQSFSSLVNAIQYGEKPQWTGGQIRNLILTLAALSPTSMSGMFGTGGGDPTYGNITAIGGDWLYKIHPDQTPNTLFFPKNVWQLCGGSELGEIQSQINSGVQSFLKMQLPIKGSTDTTTLGALLQNCTNAFFWGQSPTPVGPEGAAWTYFLLGKPPFDDSADSKDIGHTNWISDPITKSFGALQDSLNEACTISNSPASKDNPTAPTVDKSSLTFVQSSSTFMNALNTVSNQQTQKTQTEQQQAQMMASQTFQLAASLMELLNKLILTGSKFGTQ